MTKKELESLRVQSPFQIPVEERDDEYGHYSTGTFKYNGAYIIIANENGKWHMSVSFKKTPTYHVLKQMRYTFMPNDMSVAQMFPRREEFVNIHETCYHYWEI